MTRIKSVPILQTAKVLGALHFMLGAVGSCVGMILMMVIPTESPVVYLTVLVAMPVGAGLLGFGGSALACWLYNQICQWIGGVRIDLEEEGVASQPQSEEEFDEGADVRLTEEGARRLELRPISAYRLKPNPARKDWNRDGSPSPDQLGGEWVDIRNQGQKAVNTKGVGLYHLARAGAGGKLEFRLVVNLPDFSLKAGEILRLHAGKPRELSVLRAEDRTGANWHSFTGEDAYVWDTREGDTVTLYDAAMKKTIDSASYEPSPPEDVVLQRQDAAFVPARAAAGGYR